MNQINAKIISKLKKKKKENYHQTLHIQINLDSKFQLQQAILVFGTNFQTEKNEHHY